MTAGKQNERRKPDGTGHAQWEAFQEVTAANRANIEATKAQVANLASEFDKLETKVDAGFANVASALTEIRAAIAKRDRTNWPVLLSALGVLLTVAVIIAALVSPRLIALESDVGQLRSRELESAYERGRRDQRDVGIQTELALTVKPIVDELRLVRSRFHEHTRDGHPASVINRFEERTSDRVRKSEVEGRFSELARRMDDLIGRVDALDKRVFRPPVSNGG